MRRFVAGLLLAASTTAAAGEPDCAELDCVAASRTCRSMPLFDPSRPALFSWDGLFKAGDGPPGPDQPLSTNRPSFTTGVKPVGAGVVQVESGYTYTHRAGGPLDVHGFPEINPRVGLLDWLEVFGRYSYADQVALSPSFGPVGSGTQDAAFGAKVLLSPQRGVLPQLAVQPELTLPFTPPAAGSAPPPGGRPWRPTLWTLASWSLTDELTLGGSTRLSEQLDGTTYAPYFQTAPSAYLNYSPTKSATVFGETYAFLPSRADAVLPKYYAQAGLLLRPTNDVQFDVRAGLGLNAAADDFFTGAGLSLRFGPRQRRK